MQTVNIQSKTYLARLLAMEGVNVVYNPKASTAKFDLIKRTVELPVLKDMQNYMHDAFIGHEISHALHTPPQDYIAIQGTGPGQVPGVYINITEDGRIEKLIQRKYPGLRSDFRQFYEKLTSKGYNFFDIEGKDLTKFSLIDRINLQFKCGHLVHIPFLPQEQKYIDMVANEETWQDAVDAARAIYEYDSENQNVSKEQQEQEGDGESSEDGATGKEVGQSEQEESQSQNKNKPVNYKESPEAGHTQKAFEIRIQNIYEKNSVADFGDLFDMSGIFKSCIVEPSKYTSIVDRSGFTNFMQTINPIVNMMVAEFHMRKSANDYQKTREAKTGKINIDRLATYQTNSNIFHSSEIIPDAQNHGMVMFVDWSGSMEDIVFHVFKQTVVLAEFCKKVGIPFEVWGFTSRSEYGMPMPYIPNGQAHFSLEPRMIPSIFKLFDSSIPYATYKDEIAKLYGVLENDQANSIKTLSDTPLYAVGVLSDKIMHDFAKKYRTQKNSLILLTDGSSSDWMTAGQGVRGGTCHVRSPRTGKIYTCSDTSHYQKMFKMVKEEQGLFKLIGFYLAYSPSTYTISDRQHDANKIRAAFERDGHCCLENTNDSFDKFFMVNPYTLELSNISKDEAADIDTLVVQKNKMLFMREFVKEIS